MTFCNSRSFGFITSRTETMLFFSKYWRGGVAPILTYIIHPYVSSHIKFLLFLITHNLPYICSLKRGRHTSRLGPLAILCIYVLVCSDFSLPLWDPNQTMVVPCIARPSSRIYAALTLSEMNGKNYNSILIVAKGEMEAESCSCIYWEINSYALFLLLQTPPSNSFNFDSFNQENFPYPNLLAFGWAHDLCVPLFRVVL